MENEYWQYIDYDLEVYGMCPKKIEDPFEIWRDLATSTTFFVEYSVLVKILCWASVAQRKTNGHMNEQRTIGRMKGWAG